MKKFKIAAIASFTACIILALSAFIKADDPFTELLKKLEDFAKKNPTEKIHLHLDKPYYAIGDNIWFKAYVIDGSTSMPSQISNILYVELINEKDSVKRQLKLPMQMGLASGDFKLIDSLSEGNYRIRAYTQWMRNAGPQFFFDKTIKIGNAWANKVFTNATNQFSNEGNMQKVKSTIRFATIEGTAYADAPVSYEIQLNNRNISRGKATTNANGEISIDIVNSQPEIYKSGKIVATLTMPNKTTVIKTIPIKATSNKVDVQFFPEGGNLIEGLPSKVAIKAVNSMGLGENVSYIITDNDGNEISKSKTTHLGMGSFILNPLSGRTYTAKVTFADGSTQAYPLPKIEKSGYAIAANISDTANVNIKVMMTPDLLNKGELKLVATHDGIAYLTAKIPTGKQLVVVPSPRKELPSGIIQFTLFSADNLPVCERIVFINNVERINLKLENLSANYQKRGHVQLSFLADRLGKPTQGSFSISVTNASVVTPDPQNESNIFTSLLLTSDLVGYVEKPNYYFLKDDAETANNLDLLMLTQGWRKIEWKKISAGLMPQPLFMPEKTLKISGRITRSGKPVVKGKVSLFSNTGGFFATDTLSDEDGRFTFDNILFGDSVKFVVQARTDKDKKNVQIDLDMSPRQIVTTNANTGDIEVNVNETMKSYLQQSDDYFNDLVRRGLLDRTIMLKTVEIVEKKNPTPNSANLNGAGRADAIFTEKDLENAYSLANVIQGRVAGITVMGGRAYSMRANGRAMRVVLDGFDMGEDFTLDDIPVTDIESVEVLKSIANTAIYGGRGAAGVIVVTSKRGGSRSSSDYNRYTPGIIAYSPKGFYQARTFYSPRYDKKPDPGQDLRTTVYWNPHFISDAIGKAKVDYFNTDQAGEYRIVVEGIDMSGNLVHQTYTYQVK